MNARDFLTNVFIIFAVMAAGALVELAVPLFAAPASQRERRTANVGLTMLGLLVNWLLVSCAAVLSLWLQPSSLGAMLGIPRVIQIVAGVVLLDFFTGYVAHRTMHMLPGLWRAHKIHHSDSFVDVTTFLRMHPIELLWRYAFVLVSVLIFGIPAEAVIIQRLLQVTNGILEHANVRLPRRIEGVLSLVWVTPNVHKVHHSRVSEETNSNYGNLLSVYDRLLGTFLPPARAETVVYGLDETDDTQASTVRGLLWMPFQRPDTKVRVRAYQGR